MSTNGIIASGSEAKTLHLVGIHVTHSIAPSMHNHIARSLGLPWTFHATECPSLSDVMTLARDPKTAGLVVTMPYKNTIMQHLDGLDELAVQIGACNNVYRDPKDPTKLRGTNTDWLGIRGCLLEGGAVVSQKSALIVGAGGASRAAVYALHTTFHASMIYILNRDDVEVEALLLDAKRLSPPPKIVHVKTPEQAQGLATPYYIVGTVPDFEPTTAEELSVKASLNVFLERNDRGVLLDMCFKPRRTRMIQQAERNGWSCVEGTHVIGYQIEEQYRLWTGEEEVLDLDGEAARSVLLEQAEKAAGINF